MTRNKGIFFEIPESVWEQFIRVLPGRGERTAFLRAIIYKVVDTGKAFELSDEVKKEIKKWKEKE